jgi:IPT/TIG domain-containing protein
MSRMFRVVALFVGLSVALPALHADISATNPTTGTVGTEITILGSVFGSVKGDVLLGEEKCKVLGWNDTRITCQVQTAQSPGAYVMTVVLAGPKTEERLAYSYRYFTILPPQLSPGELQIEEKNTVRIQGAFFGDKKGDVRLAWRGTGIQIVEPQVRDWDMDSISFELPEDLRGNFLLEVRNAVGAGYAVLELGDGVPVLSPVSLLGTTPSGEYRDRDVTFGATGIVFKGKFFIFSTKNDATIEARTYDTTLNKMSAPDSTFPAIKTYATAKPLVVGDKLFVFTNAATFPDIDTFGKLEYTGCTYNASNDTCVWAPWRQILDITSPEGLSPAPVYNPVKNRIEVYYNKHYWDKGYIRWVYYDYDQPEAGWTGSKADVGNLTPVGLQNAPGAVYYNDAVYGDSTLLAVKNSHEDDHGIVYLIKNGTVVRKVFDFGKFGDQDHTPSLVDVGDSIALIYPSAKDDPFLYFGQSDTPMIRSMNKQTGIWSGPIQAVEMQINDGWGTNLFLWPPTGALTCELNSSDNLYHRKLYLFYGHEFYPYPWFTDSNPFYEEWVLLGMNQFIGNLGDLGTCN